MSVSAVLRETVAVRGMAFALQLGVRSVGKQWSGNGQIVLMQARKASISSSVPTVMRRPSPQPA